MKKCILFSMFAAALAATAGTATIYSCNTVGVHKVTGSYSEIEVPAPFEKVGGGNIDLESLLYIDNLTTGDSIQTCLNSQYGFYNLWSTINMPLYGMALFYPSSRTMRTTGGSVEVIPPEASNFTVPSGTGIKITRSNTSSGVYVMGQYTTARPTTTIEGNKRSYLVNPLDVDLDIETAFTNSNGVNRNDRIIILDGTTEKVYQWNRNGSNNKHWRMSSYEIVNGEEVVSYVYDSPKIGPGKGFTYERNTSSSLTFAW